MTIQKIKSKEKLEISPDLVFPDGQNTVGPNRFSIWFVIRITNVFFKQSDFVLVYVKYTSISPQKYEAISRIREKFIQVLVKKHKIQIQEVIFFLRYLKILWKMNFFSYKTSVWSKQKKRKSVFICCICHGMCWWMKPSDSSSKYLSKSVIWRVFF